MRALILMLCLALAPLPAAAVGRVIGQGQGAPLAAVVEYEAARRLVEAERYDEAITALQDTLTRWPDLPDVHNVLGFALRKVGRFDEAHQHYARALELEPAHRQAREYLGELYLEQGQPDLARDQLAELVRLCPQGCEEFADLLEAIEAYQPR